MDDGGIRGGELSRRGLRLLLGDVGKGGGGCFLRWGRVGVGRGLGRGGGNGEELLVRLLGTTRGLWEGGGIGEKGVGAFGRDGGSRLVLSGIGSIGRIL